MKHLLIVRHEDAHPAADDGGDALRALTPTGRNRMYAQARKLFEYLPGLDRIWTSPLVRAVQTSEILVGAFDGDTPVVASRTVLNPGDLNELVKLSESGPSPLGVVAVVGHEPTMGALLQHTAGLHRSVSIRTGQATLLRKEGERYVVKAAFRGGESIAI